MKITKQELATFNLLENLPESLKKMSDNEFFVFYYDVDEENVKLNIYESLVVKDVNVSLYKNMSGRVSTYQSSSLECGYFSNTFESRDGLFYQLLRTFNPIDKVLEFYRFIKEQDKLVEINVSTDAINTINTSDDFRRAMSYYCENRIQTIMFVYDMVNQSFKDRLSKSLYGQSIISTVNLIKIEGGLLPEIGGTFRYMVLGEKAELTDLQKENLSEAKKLVRSMIPIDLVYQKTGWALSNEDGKWRTNIADNESKIIDTYLQDFNGRKLYVPPRQTIESVIETLKNKDFSNGKYNGRLINVLHHPTLFEYYPKLALMPIIYWYGDKASNQEFYFASNEAGGYIIINGSKSSGDSLSILLHEIQHYIQNEEGFATGGNLFLAQFVASVGTKAVRRVFASINKFERYFRDYVLNEESRLELYNLIKFFRSSGTMANQLQSMLMNLLNNSDRFFNEYKTLCFYLVLLLAEEGDWAETDVIKFLADKFENNDRVLFELFENVSDAYENSKKYEQILSQKFRKEDIRIVLFKAYQNLYGELESRSVQSSRFVEGEFKNYFYIKGWDNSPDKQITVIDGVEEIIDTAKILGAVETKDEKYVMHFSKQFNSVPFLHELGHIVHDGLNKLGYEEKIVTEFSEDVYYKDLDEFFVAKFMGYLKARIDDKDMLEDMYMDNTISENVVINEILDEFFTDTTVSSRLKYLQTILLSI